MDELLENFSVVRSPKVRRALLDLLRRHGGGDPGRRKLRPEDGTPGWPAWT